MCMTNISFFGFILSRLMMVGVGLLSFVAQIGLTVSLQLEEAGKVSIMRKAGDILFAFLFQITIFNVSLHCSLFHFSNLCPFRRIFLGCGVSLVLLLCHSLS